MQIDVECEILNYPLLTQGPRPKRFYAYKGADYVSTQIRTARPWEYFHTSNLYRQLARGGSFVEVGANIGVDTVLASDFFRMCYAFEPSARNAEVLWKNLELNGVGNVQVFPVAVSDRIGKARLYRGHPLNSGTSALEVNEPGMEARFDEVETVTLDSALPDVTDATYLHIDAEGHDMRVLRGARAFIQRQASRPFIQMEFQPAMMSRHGTQVDELIDFLREFRYSAGFNANGTPVRLSAGILAEMFHLWKATKGWIDIYLAPE